MSDVLSSVPPVSGPPLMFPVPPVTPVQGKPVPPWSSSTSSSGQSPRADTADGVGSRLDILV